MIDIIKFSKDILSISGIDTIRVLEAYQSLIKTNIASLSESVGTSGDSIKTELNYLRSTIEFILGTFLEGDVIRSLDKVKELSYILDECLVEIPVGTIFYRARENKTNYLYSKDGMFHIPFSQRGKISNQRYSISGVPCLYLGGSTYICWEELHRPEFSNCNFSGFKTVKTVKVYDMCMPTKIQNEKDIYKVAVILACSVHARSNDTFKEQYVLPQLILQHIINGQTRLNGDGYVYGVCYYSTHFLSNESLSFPWDGEESKLSRYTNYVFPSIYGAKDEEYSPQLKDIFEFTNPLSYNSLLISNEANFYSRNNEPYLDSTFGMIDHILNQKMNVKDGYLESVVFTCRPSED